MNDNNNLAKKLLSKDCFASQYLSEKNRLTLHKLSEYQE